MTDQVAARTLAGQRIGFFGRGGAGKGTVVVLLSRALVQAGYTVCIVDADSTNVGLHEALGLAAPPSPLIDYFGGVVFRGGPVNCPVDDPTPLANAALALGDLPAEYCATVAPRPFLLLAGKLGGWGAGAGCGWAVDQDRAGSSAHGAGGTRGDADRFQGGF